MNTNDYLVGSLPDGTSLTAWMEFSEVEHAQFLVEASGTSSALQEVGEQLAWISTALQSSPFEAVTSCNPTIVRFRSSTTGVSEANPRLDCDIEHTCRSMEKAPVPVNGECWYRLFRNPVLVEGFPISLRTERDTGLEIPLNVMGSLADTRRVDEFNGKLFIKGFATMLYPTRQSEEDVIIWHLRCREDGERISYFEAQEPHVKVQISALERARHIVGWCSEAEILAGKGNKSLYPLPFLKYMQGHSRQNMTWENRNYQNPAMIASFRI